MTSTAPATHNWITSVSHSASGASCQIHALGATVLSFRSASGREHMFVSDDAVLDGSAAIRGGIPICFPIFGPPTHPSDSTMPQHGFARLNRWTLDRTYDEPQAAGAVFSLQLKDVTAGRGENNPWSITQAAVDGTDCVLTYEVRLEAHQLTSTLVCKNTGADGFDFQMLLHNYFKVDQHAAHDPAKTFVKGLGGYSIIDKITGNNAHVQSYDEPIVLAGETDRVYIHPEDHPLVHAEIGVGLANAVTLRLEAAGQADEQVAPISCVVWNPAAAKAAALPDFGNEQYHDMICVEPGLIGHQPILNPGFEARLTQTIVAPPA